MLEVLDTAGQEGYIALRDRIRDGEGFVLVYSISSQSSFACIQKFHHRIQQVKESNGSTFCSAPVMLVGNKCDRTTEREVSYQEGSTLAHELGCGFVEASAKHCVNVDKAFYDVVRELRRQRQRQRQGFSGSIKSGIRKKNRREEQREQRQESLRGQNSDVGKITNATWFNDMSCTPCVIL